MADKKNVQTVHDTKTRDAGLELTRFVWRFRGISERAQKCPRFAAIWRWSSFVRNCATAMHGQTRRALPLIRPWEP
jgi:hypothetical protein